MWHRIFYAARDELNRCTCADNSLCSSVDRRGKLAELVRAEEAFLGVM